MTTPAAAIAANTSVTRTPRAHYQNIVLAEFVACILLTALTPVATKKEADGLSPYAGKDIIKLGAITVLFLILAFMSSASQGAGRLAAWFGGLILITDGMLEASNIAKDLALFTGRSATPAPESPVPGPGRGLTPLPLGSTTGSLFPVVGPGGTGTTGPAEPVVTPTLPAPGPNPLGA